MILSDIGKSPEAILKKVNKYLRENFGFKISRTMTGKDFTTIVETIENEINQLKLNGEVSNKSPEIAKRLLILEGLRSIRENELEMQSPKLEIVINGLADYVVDTFELSGMCSDDYETAISRAMDEYRSSRYRFPDDYIEQRLRDETMSRLGQLPGDDNFAFPDSHDLFQDEDDINTVGVLGIYEQGKTKMQGKIVKETKIVNKLRYLLETEVSQAEVMMASKGFAQDLQEMIEKIGRLQNEDLPPVTDQMRETYGTDSASAFQTQIYGALQSVMNSLYTAKGQVDDAVTNMAENNGFTLGTDMDRDITGDEETADLDDRDLDNISPDEYNDEFAGAETEEPLGRSLKKESIMSLEKKLVEMKRLVHRARRLKEQKNK